jgi:hypothetical protein
MMWFLKLENIAGKREQRLEAALREKSGAIKGFRLKFAETGTVLVSFGNCNPHFKD